MANVFTKLQVYPQRPDYTLVEWELHPEFDDTGPYIYTVQFSRSGVQTADDWVDVSTVSNASHSVIQVVDIKQRSWSAVEQGFYRVKLVTGNGTYYSYVESTFGSLDRADKLKLREIFRQQCLRFTKQVGSKGQLFRRRYWGVRASTVDPDTEEVINPKSTEDYGTGFVGGYWPPFTFWLEFLEGTSTVIEQKEIGTVNNVHERARCLAWPLPRTNDVWVDCTSGARYIIKTVTMEVVIRSYPVIALLDIRLAPPTDIIYSLPLDV